MDTAAGIFRYKRFVADKLLAYGFEPDGGSLRYSAVLPDSGFVLTVSVSGNSVGTLVLDPATGEPYTLHLTDGALGSFVGSVRSDYEDALTEIAESCCESDVFQSEQSKELISFARETYGDELEFLWQDTPDCAVWRRKDTGKWYGLITVLPRRKLGLDEPGTVEIADLHGEPEEIARIADGRRYFPAWHMNKKHWYTVPLDGSVSTEELFSRVEKSYELAKK